MALIRVTTPLPLAVTLEDARSHLLLDEQSDKDLDDKITRALLAALQWAADMTSRAVAVASYEMRLNCWPRCRSLEIPIAPVREVEAITYRDADNVEQTVDPAQYQIAITDRTSWLTFAPEFSAPAVSHDYPFGVVIRVSAGFDAYETESADRDIYRMPAGMRQAILMKMESEFEAGAIDDAALARLAQSAENLILQNQVLRM